jgi:hypothetical protein
MKTIVSPDAFFEIATGYGVAKRRIPEGIHIGPDEKVVMRT